MRLGGTSFVKRCLEPLIVSFALILPILFAGVQIGEHYRADVYHEVTRDVQPAGFFEGRGAINLQCRWDTPEDVTDRITDGDQAPARYGEFEYAPGSDWEGAALFGVARRGDGHFFFINGSNCSYSIDWGAMPASNPTP